MQILQKAKANARGHGLLLLYGKYVPARRADMVGGVAWKRTRTEVWASEKRDFIVPVRLCVSSGTALCFTGANQTCDGMEGAMEMDDF